MIVTVVDGNILDQQVDAIVNPWNRNIIPWWLLLPQGVSGAIKKRAGYQPFKELARIGPIPLGQAVATSAGRLSYKAIIHVAGINMLWRASAYSIQNSVRNAVSVAEELNIKTLAFPLIGAGSGGFSPKQAERLMFEVFAETASDIEATVVRFNKACPSRTPDA